MIPLVQTYFVYLQLDRRPFEEKISSGHIWDSCMKLEFCNLSEEVKTNFFPGIHHLSNKSDLYTVSYTFVLETECKSFSELRENARKTWQSRVEFHRGNLSSTGWLGPSEGADGAGQGILGQGILDCQTSKPRLWRRDISGQWLSESSSDKETALRSKILDGPFADPWSQIWLENICLGHKRWPTKNLSVWRRSSKVGRTHFFLLQVEFMASSHRFSTEPYTTDPEHIGNNFIHLTNYSINKDSENFEQNTDPDSPKVGLKSHLEDRGRNASGFKVVADQPLEVSSGKLCDREETNMGQRSNFIIFFIHSNRSPCMFHLF